MTIAGCMNTAMVQDQGRAAHDEFVMELEARQAKLDYDSTCVMLYTSGTTGKPQRGGAVKPEHHRGGQIFVGV